MQIKWTPTADATNHQLDCRQHDGQRELRPATAKGSRCASFGFPRAGFWGWGGRLLASVLFVMIGLALAGPNSWLATSVAQDGGFKMPLSLGRFGGATESAATWSASYRIVPGTDEGVLEIEAVLSHGWHTFSTTQPKGGPLRTEIKVIGPPGIQLSSAFKPDHAPEKSVSDVFDGLTIEEFHDSVIWSAPIVLPPGYQGDVKVQVDGQTCSEQGMCTPVEETLVAKFAGDAQPVQTVADTGASSAAIKLSFDKAVAYREAKNPVQWTAVASQSIAAGGRGAIQFTAVPNKGFHVYTAAIDDAKSSTNFVVTKKSGLKVGAPTTNAKVIVDNEIPVLPLKYHKGDVTWSLPVEAPTGTAAGDHVVEGIIVYQACTSEACFPPAAINFKTTISVGKGGNQATEVVLTPAKYTDGLNAAGKIKWVDKLTAPSAAKPDQSRNDPSAAPAISADQPSTGGTSAAANSPPIAAGTHSTDGVAKESSSSEAAGPAIDATVVKDSSEAIAEMAKLYDANEKIRYLTLADMDANPIGSGGVSSFSQTTFWSAMFGAFVGGMLLNLMPCVFPVLGLKVMGFVQQSGSNPAKIRMHGIAFGAGLLVAMWVLAGVIMTIKFSLGQAINWGAQMGNPYFVCAMIVLLFLLGLNMAGVFEFGTSMTRVGGAVQGKEGYTSSFLSGVLTTLIATPCSGPFLGAAMSYTLAQTAVVAMTLFTVFGLGIAMPYLMLCFFPSLINKLPRPGAWMETFKVTMAFAMFATVAFFLNTFGNQVGVNGMSLLVMALVVIALSAYFYGRYSPPHIAQSRRWAYGYIMPLVIASAGGWMCLKAASETSQAGSTYQAGGLAWQDWNPGKVEYTLIHSKRPVWVEYTAHW